MQIDNEVTAFYENWKSAYLKIGCGDTTQYYIEYSNGNAICVSEGQGYGMVVEAYMAGYDPLAKKYFDGLYKWYKMHPSNINPLLMNWQQDVDCISIGDDAATDGDLDIGYALLLADKQWGSGGTINYLQEALNIIDAIKQSETYSVVNSTRLGDWANGDPDSEDDTRPSDFMYDHFRSFQNAASDNTWTDVLDECYDLVDSMQINFSPATGLLPDFIEDCDGAPHPAAPNFLEGPEDGYYYYNSCRTPWHLGADYLVNGDIRAKNACDIMNTWLKTHTSNNINNIRSGYKLDGTNISGNNYQDLSFMAPFAVGACVNSANQTWVNDLWTYIIDEPLSNGDYYSNSIKMLCMIIMAGDYWAPQSVTTGISNNNVSENESNHIEVFPNPMHDKCNLKFNMQNISDAVLCVYNNMGQMIFMKNYLSLSKGENTITIDVEKFSEGIYSCKLYTKNEIIIGRLIVK